MRYLITGGTGFIGKALVDSLILKDHHVTLICRDSSKVPKGCTSYTRPDDIPNDAVFDVIINLAGSPIDRRWTAAVKEDLITSRVATTKALVEKIRKLTHKPQVMISASAVGYYGVHSQGELDENAPGTPSFTNELCQAWEMAAKKAESIGVRVCIVRLGVVLGSRGGALKKILPPFKWGLGSVLGTGDQPFSWIHLDDVLGAFVHLIHHTQSTGIYNLTAPHILTYKEFAKAVGESVDRPVYIKLPGFILQSLLGEMAQSLLLQGHRVVPRHLLDEGFHFKFPKIDKALENVVSLNIR
jgi:uncharacterized protein